MGVHLNPHINEFDDPSPLNWYIEQPIQITNDCWLNTWGGEFWTAFQPSPRFRLRGWVSYYREAYRLPAETLFGGDQSGITPRRQASLEGYWDPFPTVKLNAAWRYVDPLPTVQVPAYQTMDARVAWSPWKAWELAVTGRNLFAPKHVEFVTHYLDLVTSMVERTYLLSLTMKW